jgi:hypothetical protein
MPGSAGNGDHGPIAARFIIMWLPQDGRGQMLMPSHALPRGRKSRARRRAEWRRSFPVVMVGLTGVEVAGPSLPAGSIGNQILDIFRSAGGVVLFTIAFVLALMPVYLHAEKLREAQTAPRPRWQYLAIAAVWASLAAGLAFASLHLSPGWLARASGALTFWFAAFGLAMLGRAACWGRVRNVFWWFRPRWIADDEAT